MRGAALIVLAWNQWALTRIFLDSLLANDLDEAGIIVVDNGSDDETPIALKDYLAAYPGIVKVVSLPENLGFVRGMNAGIAAARPEDDVVLLNNDLVITQRDWLNRLRDAAYARPEYGVIGCRMHGGEGDQRLFHLGGFIEPESLWGQQTESGIQEVEAGQFTRTRRVQGIAFAVAYIRRDCLTRVGPLDEIFHSYFEDTDYCLRAADAGIASVVAGAVTLRHDQHGSTRDDGGFRERLWKQSRAAFAQRWQQRLIDAYRGTVHWQGVTGQAHAHAQITRSLLWRLDARGLRMAFSKAAPELLDAQDFRLGLAAHRSIPPAPEVAFVCAPGGIEPIPRGRFRVALGISEWEQAPPSWARYSQQFDLLLVPDAFQQRAFRAAGVSIPIEILPLGIDRDYCQADAPTVRNPHAHFVFLSVVESLPRDAPDRIVTAFRQAFDATEPVELLIRVVPGNDDALIHAAIEAAIAATPGAPVRVISYLGFQAHERMQLLCAADTYVSARRGGGWDPLAAEAVACARPLIAPAYGSQESLVREWGHEVACRSAEDPANPGQRWCEPDLDSLVARLREVHEQRSFVLTAARIAAPRFAQAHDLDNTADRLAELLASGSTLKPRPSEPAPHRPVDLDLPSGNQIVVLGMHRSGTSSVGGLLKLFGAWPGEDDALLRGPDNPRGHFEHGELHLACVRRLEADGGDWRFPPEETSAAAIDAFRRDIAAILETLEARRPWFIKEPRLCLLVHEILPLLTRPVFVHVTRDPGAIAASLARRDRMGSAAALTLCEHYKRAALAASEGWQRVTIDYDELIADPLKTARNLLNELVGCGITGLDWPGDDAITRWIEPSVANQGNAAVGD